MTADRRSPGPAAAPPASLSIDDLDVIAPGAFAAAVAPLFEGARGFLGRLAMARPFGTPEAMFDTARAIAHAMPLDEQIELIDAHPRLGAPPADVSALSFAEQGYGDEATAAKTAATADRRRGRAARAGGGAGPARTPRTRRASGSATASSSPAGPAPSCCPG